MRWTTLHVPDLDCPEELRLIQAGLRSLPQVGQLRPDYLSRTLRVEHDATSSDAADIVAQLQQIGFSATLAESPRHRHTPPHGLLRLLRQPDLLLATLLLATLLLARAFGHFWQSSPERLVAALATAAALLAGWPVAHHAWRAARLHHLDMHVLMTLAMTGAIFTGEWLEAATGMVLFRFALLIDEVSKQRAQQAIQSLLELNPTVAHRLPSTEGAASRVQDVEDVQVDRLQVGDVVLIRPGERIPADGRVVAGSSAVNQAPITGESLPVEKRVGDTLYGGSLNGEGSLQVRVTQTAEFSTLARISRLIEQAQSTPSPTERVIDQFARRYTPAVIALAVTLAILPLVVAWVDPQAVGLTSIGGWWPFWKQWFLRGLVMLIVACPCALVLSTPITIVCGLHRASRLGILVKGGEFLERVGCLRWLALDKTGTVTQGKPRVVEVLPLAKHSESEVLTLAAALEQHSEHPLATAILREALSPRSAIANSEQSQTLRGFGVHATLAGQRCTVGSLRYFQQQGWLSASDLPAAAQEPSGASVVAVARETTVIGLILLRDQLREGAAATLRDWRRLGIERLIMLTGDHQSAAEPIAQELELDEYHADLLPEDKIDRIRQLASRQPALGMVGDGVNDAPALAAASIGIALGSGASDVALETADVAILSPQLDRVTELIQLSRRTRWILKQNIALALGIKLLVMLLALAGQATMWMAVASDVGASLLVIFNGTRLLRPVGRSVIKRAHQDRVAPPSAN